MLRLLLTLTLVWASNFVLAGGSLVRYTVNGQEYEGYYISTQSAAPLVLLVHDWDGLTDYEIKRANMLAEMGYTVFAADMFGAGVRPVEVKDRRQHTGELYKNREKMRSLLKGALEYAKSRGANVDNAVTAGYCFGGAVVLEFARNEAAVGFKMKGYATFHGGLKTPEGQGYSPISGKILVMHGAADTAITMDQFAKLSNELEEARIDHEMITYGGAPHAFTVFGGDRYREAADRKSWLRFSSFLEETTR